MELCNVASLPPSFPPSLPLHLSPPLQLSPLPPSLSLPLQLSPPSLPLSLSNSPSLPLSLSSPSPSPSLPLSLSLSLPPSSYMYWVDRDVNGARIERAKLDGSNRDVFPKDLDNPTHLLPEPTYLTVDPVTGIVYWFDAEREGQINNENTARHGIKGAGYAVGADYVYGLTVL